MSAAGGGEGLSYQAGGLKRGDGVGWGALQMGEELGLAQSPTAANPRWLPMPRVMLWGWEGRGCSSLLLRQREL